MYYDVTLEFIKGNTRIHLRITETSSQRSKHFIFVYIDKIDIVFHNTLNLLYY